MTLNIRLNRIIFILSLVGIAIAIYVLQSFLRQSPIVCINSGCEIVRKSIHSYPMGIPVPAFGLIGYTVLALCSFLRTVSSKKIYVKIMFGISLFGVSFVTWFTYTELFVIKAICTWCAISAGVMIIICILVLKSFLLGRHR